MRTPDVSTTSASPSLTTEEKRDIKKIDDELKRVAAIISALPRVPAKNLNLPQIDKHRNYQIEISIETDRDPPVDLSQARLEQPIPSSSSSFSSTEQSVSRTISRTKSDSPREIDRNPAVGQSPLRLEQPIPLYPKGRHGHLFSDCTSSQNLLQVGMPLSPERVSCGSPPSQVDSPSRTVAQHKSDSPNLEEAKRAGSKKASRVFRRCVIL